jgi:hypothetical protein
MAAVNAAENNRLTPEDRAKLDNAKADCQRTGNNTSCGEAEGLESLDNLTDLLDEPGLGRDGALVKNALDEALPLVKGAALDTIVGDGKGGVMRGGVYVAVDFLIPGGAVELAGTLVGGKLILVAGELYLMSGAGKVIGRVSASAEKAVRQALNTAKPGVKAEAGAAGKLGSGADNVATYPKLRDSLASEEQLSQLKQGKGVVLAGQGSKVSVRDAPRLAAQYGGEPSDWVKVSSGSFKSQNGKLFEIHAYRNVKTGQVVEPKTKTSYK